MQASVTDVCLAARDASRTLAALDGATRAGALEALAVALEDRTVDQRIPRGPDGSSQ